MSQAFQPVRSLCEDLELVPVRRLHGLEDFEDEVGRHSLMEEIAHRVDEDGARLFPSQGKVQTLGPKLEVEPLLKRMTRHAAKPFCKRLGIAVLAARTYLRAAGDWVPGGVGPFDWGVLRHLLSNKMVVQVHQYSVWPPARICSRVRAGRRMQDGTTEGFGRQIELQSSS